MYGILKARKEAGNMKILFINLPYHGHVIPTIGLVQELIKAGHQVTYLMPHDWESKIKDSGADFLGYENHPQLDKQIRNAFFKAEEVIADFDLLIYEQFFFVGKHLAEKYGKKCSYNGKNRVIPFIRTFLFSFKENHNSMKHYYRKGNINAH